MYKYLFTISPILYFLPVKAQQYALIQTANDDCKAVITSVSASEPDQKNCLNFKPLDFADLNPAPSYNYKRQANKYKTKGILMASAGGGLLLGGLLGFQANNAPPRHPAVIRPIKTTVVAS